MPPTGRYLGIKTLVLPDKDSGIGLIEKRYELNDGTIEKWRKIIARDVVVIMAFTPGMKAIVISEDREGLPQRLQLIAGDVEGQETPAEAAKRELREEPGYEGKLVYVTNFSWDTVKSERKIHIFAAMDCKKVSEPEAGIKVSTMDPRRVRAFFRKRLLTDPLGNHGGPSSYIAAEAVLEHLGIISPEKE